jgi:DNA (cytosine-5)-methyltransferase 1
MPLFYKNMKKIKYLSVCSGIEAATVAWHHMGWEAVGFSEIEKFPSEVLKHHYPTVTNFGDMTKYKEWNLGTIELLVGGTPCQSFSVAGLRKGLEDPRGNLMLTYCGLLDKFKPKWFVWENVPGVLSSSGGRDFGSFLGAVAELGYGWAYRVLDAQYFGVAQRRRRVFVVGCLGDWESAAKVLFEPESLSGHPAPSRSKRKEASREFVPSLANCLQTTANDYSRADGFNMIAFENSRRDGVRLYDGVSNTLQAFMGTGGGNSPMVSYSLQGSGSTSQNANGLGINEDISFTLNSTDQHGVAYSFDSLASNSMKSKNPNSGCRQVELSKTLDTTVPDPSKNQGGIGIVQTYDMKSHHNPQPIAFSKIDNGQDATENLSPTLRVGGNADGVMAVAQPIPFKETALNNMAVRKLTPVECERLQGFPDNYTDIKPKGKDTPDGPRYKALGNSMAVPVMAWIGKRIQMVEDQAK